MNRGATNLGAHCFDDRGDDYYETPACAVRALIENEELPNRLWEPAAGRGSIVGALRAGGFEVHSTDLVEYPGTVGGVDFLRQFNAPALVEGIVTNPPYRYAEQFATHALSLVPYVAMLLRLAFLESTRRTALLERGHLARVLVFRNRLPMMHRAGWVGAKSTSAVAYAWFIWDRTNYGPTVLKRISWSS